MHNVGTKPVSSNSGKTANSVEMNGIKSLTKPTFNSLPATGKENSECATSSSSKNDQKPPKEVSIPVEKDSESDDSGNDFLFDPELGSAPIELKAEFIDTIQDKDWENALKLCKMILIYEPNNQTATEYLSVLEQRMLLDEDASDGEESEEGTSSGDEDDDDDDDDDDEDQSDDDEENRDDSDSEYESDDSDSDSQVVIDISKK